MLYPLLNSYVKPLARITEIAAEIIDRTKNVVPQLLTTHYTADSQSPSTPYTEPQFPPPFKSIATR